MGKAREIKFPDIIIEKFWNFIDFFLFVMILFFVIFFEKKERVFVNF